MSKTTRLPIQTAPCSHACQHSADVHVPACRFNSLATVCEEEDEASTEVGSVAGDDTGAGPSSQEEEAGLSREEVDAAIKQVCQHQGMSSFWH